MGLLKSGQNEANEMNKFEDFLPFLGIVDHHHQNWFIQHSRIVLNRNAREGALRNVLMHWRCPPCTDDAHFRRRDAFNRLNCINPQEEQPLSHLIGLKWYQAHTFLILSCYSSRMFITFWVRILYHYHIINTTTRIDQSAPEVSLREVSGLQLWVARGTSLGPGELLWSSYCFLSWW